MIKFKSYILAAGILVSSMSGCKEDFFDLYPTDQLSPSTFWKTEADAMAGLTGCYSSLYDVTEEVLPYLDVITPNAYNEYPWEGWKDISKGTHTAQGPGGPQGLWRGAYRGIGRVNTFLANIDQPEMGEETRERMRAEAYFLRAYYYFSIAQYFGGVPLITDIPNTDQALTPRSSKEQVIEQVLADLNASIGNLPSSIPSSENGRVSKGAALALKTRVLLYESKWAEAASTAKEVIDLGVYELFPSYRELFLPENENNKEIIFDVQFVSPEYASAWDTYIGIYDGAITPGWSSIEPTVDFVDEYEMEDGSQWSASNPVADPENKYNNRDPRLDQTIFRSGKSYNGKPYPVDDEGWAGVYTGFSFKKFTVYDEEPTSTVAYFQSYINAIVLRYADVLLMYAEAQNEASGPDASVYDAINQVRNRVNMPDLPAGLSQSEMRDRIRHERRIELVLEGLYYPDILRWKIAEDVLNKDVVLNGSNKRGVLDDRTFDPSKHYLWPIPQREIDNSQKAIEQNPNY